MCASSCSSLYVQLDFRNAQPGVPHVGEEVSRSRIENGMNATTPERHEIPPGGGGTYSPSVPCWTLFPLADLVPQLRASYGFRESFCKALLIW